MNRVYRRAKTIRSLPLVHPSLMAASVVPIVLLFNVYPVLLFALMGALYALIVNPLYYQWIRRWAIGVMSAIFTLVVAIGYIHDVQYVLIWAFSGSIYAFSWAFKSYLIRVTGG